MTRFRQDERGGVVNLAAVLMATLVGVGALAVDELVAAVLDPIGPRHQQLAVPAG